MKKQKIRQENTGGQAKFPRHDVDKALRIPEAIINQNAGKACSDEESAQFAGVGFNGPYKVEVSSALKYGFLERPKIGSVQVTDRARRAIRPQKPEDRTMALREAVLGAPEISEVYSHYRGENLPDRNFFDNAITDKFGVPSEKANEFYKVFITSLGAAKLIEKNGDKIRVLDVSQNSEIQNVPSQIKKLADEAGVKSEDTCFVVMPFTPPIGGYYETVYEAAIKKAGLTPVRADTDIFGAGKIIDQIWRGINNAKVLVAELTKRNPNVFYELGLAHALQKPVVLVSSNEEDVPFDLQHIRVIYYDVNDPFWGTKLIEKVAENVLSAIKNPEEAIFQRALDKE